MQEDSLHNSIIFSELDADSIGRVAPYMSLRPNRSCDSSPLCQYLYRHIYKPYYAIVDDCCLLMFSQEARGEHPNVAGGRELAAALPFCTEQGLPKYFELQRRYFNEVLGLPHTVYSADEEGVSLLADRELLADYEVTLHEKYSDYIYSAESLRTLSGRKLSKKRNLIHQFLKEYEGRWEYSRLGFSERAEASEFLNEWAQKHGVGDKLLEAELRGIEDVLSDERFFAENKFGAIRIDGKIRAFSIGTYKENEKMALIDVEKADHGILGLYQLINREFLLHEFPCADYVNREDDCGEPNLRQAKQSYLPLDFEKKYTLRQITRD